MGRARRTRNRIDGRLAEQIGIWTNAVAELCTGVAGLGTERRTTEADLRTERAWLDEALVVHGVMILVGSAVAVALSGVVLIARAVALLAPWAVAFASCMKAVAGWFDRAIPVGIVRRIA